MGGVAMVDSAAVMDLEGTTTAVASVVALAAHHSIAARQLWQTMKKNGIRTCKVALVTNHMSQSQYLNYYIY